MMGLSATPILGHDVTLSTYMPIMASDILLRL